MPAQLKNELYRVLFWGGLVVFVIVSAALARPRVRATTIEFPPPLGIRFIAWAQLAVWGLMIGASVDLGIYWLAGLFLLGPLYALWRWPETISIDELRIHQSAWCHRAVAILWQEIESIELSFHGDALIVRGRKGEKIGVSGQQVGSAQLIAEIERRSGRRCPELQATYV